MCVGWCFSSMETLSRNFLTNPFINDRDLNTSISLSKFPRPMRIPKSSNKAVSFKPEFLRSSFTKTEELASYCGVLKYR